jgi:chromosome partitioning protein
MKVLAILSQKGGVGKTTLATCLAVAAEQAGKVAAIIDLDPQATASFWKDVRQLDTPAVASIQPVRLPAMLKACEDAGTDLVVIDGAAVARDVAYEAARQADFILIPTKTAVFDTMSMTHTLDVVRQLDRAFAVVLTFVPPQGQETGDAIQAVAELGATVCPVTIGNRKAFFRAQAAGRPCRSSSRTDQRPTKSTGYTSIQLYAYTMKRRRRDGEGRKQSASGAEPRQGGRRRGPGTSAGDRAGRRVPQGPAERPTGDQVDWRAFPRRSAHSFVLSRPRKGRPFKAC